jgi:predicted secreted hydrolase
MSGRRPTKAHLRGLPGGRLVALALLATILTGACGGPILANAPAVRGPGPTAGPTRPPAADPQLIRFPADDGPHDRLTEWWYYTGHLTDGIGARYGFEYVIFRAERGGFPVSWAAHLAITDETGGQFSYAQRSQIGPEVDRSPRSGGLPTGFDLQLDPPSPGGGPSASAAPGAGSGPSVADSGGPWRMTGANGIDRLTAAATSTETAAGGAPTGLGLDLRLAATRPPTLHDDDGWVDFGPAGGSYYYSRTTLTASGALVLGGRSLTVTGSAWFDHQWGDFIAVGGGGWDWFAVNLTDGTDLTLSLVRAADGTLPLVYGTLVDPRGTTRHLDRTAFSVAATGSWTSSRSGAVYPSGWRIEIPGEGLTVDLTPTVQDQELDTRATTGVVYWEGSQVVRATRRGAPLGGVAYVELTGYPR